MSKLVILDIENDITIEFIKNTDIYSEYRVVILNREQSLDFLNNTQREDCKVLLYSSNTSLYNKLISNGYEDLSCNINVIPSSCSIYFRANICNSILREKTIVGDFSRVERSALSYCCKIERNNLIRNSFLGKYSYTGNSTRIFDTSIGNFVSIAWNVTIGAHEHNYKRVSSHSFVYESFNKRFGLLDKAIDDCNEESKSTIIGNDVWIGCNAVIKKGLNVGDGSIIGSGAIVTKDVPPYAIVVGNPAKIIKYRFSKEVIDRLLELKWWNWDDERINRYSWLFKSNSFTIEDLNKIL